MPIPFASAFSIAHATDSSEISTPQTDAASRCQREPDRAGAAVEVVDDLVPVSPAASRASVYSVSAISVFVCRKAFGRTRKRRPRSSSSIHGSPQSSRVGRFVTSAGRSLIAQCSERTSGNRVTVSIRKSASNRSPGAGDEHHEHLPRVPTLAHDEMTEVAGVRVLVVRLEALVARPPLDGLADRVADVRRQQALLDVDHLVPAAGSMEPEHETVVPARERVLELVPVGEDRARGHDRLDRRLLVAAETRQRLAHLGLLRRGLGVVGEILEAASTAHAEVPARRLDAVRAGLEQRDLRRLREPALHLRRPGAHEISRQPAANEDDEAVEAANAVPSVGERVDPDLDLLALAHRRSHQLVRG